jgi:hypothetical protein
VLGWHVRSTRKRRFYRVLIPTSTSSPITNTLHQWATLAKISEPILHFSMN